jgi:3-oxoadipate enol-lactonase
MEGVREGTLARWFTEPYRESRKDVMQRIGNAILATPVEGFAGCCDAIAKIDVLDRLREIDVPALVIVGEQDHGTPPEMARAIQENLRGSDLLIIPSAAHLSNVEQPEAFNNALVSFLERVENGSGGSADRNFAR